MQRNGCDLCKFLIRTTRLSKSPAFVRRLNKTGAGKKLLAPFACLLYNLFLPWSLNGKFLYVVSYAQGQVSGPWHRRRTQGPISVSSQALPFRSVQVPARGL